MTRYDQPAVDRMDAVDQLLHRGEANPRTRSGVMSVEILDRAPDWKRFLSCYERASRTALRLRQKVVAPTLPTTAPRWVVDPDFDLNYHVRRVAIAEPGFYRNSLIHAFLETSIVELALAHAATADGERLTAFWAQAMRLRDLLKFDFYFADTAAFREHVAAEMAWQPDWEAQITAGGEAIQTLLKTKRPLVAYATLRTFVEAYAIAADVLRAAPTAITEKDLTTLAMGVGRQYVAQRRIRSSEPVSALLFATAYQVLGDQHLLDPTGDLPEARANFYHELCAVLRDVAHVEHIAREQFFEREAVTKGETHADS